MDSKVRDLATLQLLQIKYAGLIDISIETRNDLQSTCVRYTNYGTGNDNPKYNMVARKLGWFNYNYKEVEEIKKDLFNIVGF